MSRALSAHLSSSTSGTTTEPWHLVQIGTLRLTDGPSTSWDGYTWVSYDGLSVDDHGSDGSGRQQGRITLPNHDGAISGLVFAGGADDVPCLVWQVYGPGPHAAGDSVLLVDGVINDVHQAGAWVEMSYVSLGADARQLPRLRIAPPTFNHVPADGTVLEWGGMRITVEGGQ
jgi:hypothetical protein